MRKTLFILLISLIKFLAFGQTDHIISNRMMVLTGQTLDKENLDTIPMVTIEIFNGDKRLDVIQSDLFGMFKYRYCTNKIISDTIELKTLYVGYLNENFKFIINNVHLNIMMTKDPKKLITKENFKDFNRRNLLYYECANFFSVDYTDDLKEGEIGKIKYKHYCTGEIKTHNEIAIELLDPNEWMQIE